VNTQLDVGEIWERWTHS